MGALTWFKMFGVMVWKLSFIEPFFIDFFLKKKIENYIGICGCSWYYWEALTKFDLIMLVP
jgi:hypothetical protein